MKFTPTLTFLMLAVVSVVAFAQVPPIGGNPATQPLIGVFEENQANFAVWKARGVNTLVEMPTGQGFTTESFQLAAEAAGLRTIRVPSTQIGFDAAHPALALMTPFDEPNNTVAPWGWQNVLCPPAQLQTICDNIRKANPGIPVFVNFAATQFYGGKQNAQDTAFFAAPDWIAADGYPLNRKQTLQWIGGPNVAGFPSELDYMGQRAPGKTRFVFIETSNQLLGMGGRGPTPDELETEVWNAFTHGSAGIIYFPQCIGSWSFDATPPDVAARITAVDAKILASFTATVVPSPQPFNSAQAWTNINNAINQANQLSALASQQAIALQQIQTLIQPTTQPTGN